MLSHISISKPTHERVGFFSFGLQSRNSSLDWIASCLVAAVKNREAGGRSGDSPANQTAYAL